MDYLELKETKEKLDHLDHRVSLDLKGHQDQSARKETRAMWWSQPQLLTQTECPKDSSKVHQDPLDHPELLARRVKLDFLVYPDPKERRETEEGEEKRLRRELKVTVVLTAYRERLVSQVLKEKWETSDYLDLRVNLVPLAYLVWMV